MKRPALQNKQVGVLRMAFRARKVFGTFQKQAPALRGFPLGTPVFPSHEKKNKIWLDLICCASSLICGLFS